MDLGKGIHGFVKDSSYTFTCL